MNIDIRLKINFFRHPKTKKLIAELGEFAPFYLIKIWIFTGEFYPDGILTNISDKFLEKEVEWPENSGKSLVQTLENIGFIDRDGNNLIIHDWQEHNSYASENDNRVNKGRFSKLKQSFPTVAEYMQTIGINSITKENYQKICTSENPIETAKEIYKINNKKKGQNPVQKSQNDPTGYLQGTQQGTKIGNPQGTPRVDISSNTNTNTISKSDTNTNSNNLNTSCSEQTSSSEQQEILQGIENQKPPPKIFINLPVVDGSEFPITVEDIKKWQDFFPAVNIEQEFRTMKAWLFAHDKRRKTKRGMNRFIQSWLANRQNNPGRSNNTQGKANYYNPADRDFYVMEKNKEVAQRWLEREGKRQESENGQNKE